MYLTPSQLDWNCGKNKKMIKMDDKGYAFAPMAFLLMVPVVVLAVSFNGVIGELNSISSIAVGGDVTATIAHNIVTAVEQDTADAGRYSAMMAVQTIINKTNIYDNHPFFGKTGSNSTGDNSKAFIVKSTVDMLNKNITETCRVLEQQTGRDIYINNLYVDPTSTDTLNIFEPNDLELYQKDPFGFYIKVKSIPIKVVFDTPVRDVYVSIEQLEDPWIWVMTKHRNSSVIYRYPYYTSSGAISDGTGGDYHFADNVAPGRLNYLWECFLGANVTVMGPRPYYFSDIYGLSFFDRLENRTPETSGSPPEARMSTFIIYDVLEEDHGLRPTSMLDHEYFEGVEGSVITAQGVTVKTPSGVEFLISPTYRGYLDLQPTY
jgi:hypothetical protein